ncbi:LysR family transcriptional regulator [Paraburkholderia guartelaensis]|uniref:LysR family transcriptional regulator n=1 Tax=Paraburkholderia guartelaensis TaxID=2546446 RepID=UPI002AB667B2|nr:LysR family transcriptional regulator [Paraburkholderia guartelaensis]
MTKKMTGVPAPARPYGGNGARESTPLRRPGISRNFSGVVGFINVALSGSLAEAARQLGVSSPSLSKSIARLESQLNVRLLERSNRKMALTAEGTILFEECFPAVNHIIRVAGDLTGSTANPVGNLRVTCSLGFGRQYVASMLPSFCSTYPGIQIDLDLTERSLDPGRNGVDVAIRHGEVSIGNFVARRLCDSALVVCASPSYLSEHGTPQTIDDLHQHRLILQRGAGTGRPVEWTFELDGEPVKRRFAGYLITNDPDLIRQTALSGCGLAQLDSRQVSKQVEAGELIPILTEFVPRGGGHFVCYHNDPRTPPRVKVFVDYLLNHLDGC